MRMESDSTLEVSWNGKGFKIVVQTHCLILFPFKLAHPDTLFRMNWNMIPF